MQAKGCVDDRIKINYYFDKHPVLSCVTPVPNTDILNSETIEKIDKQELYSKENRTLRGMKQELLKSTLPMIRQSKADFFVFDLYTFHANLIIYDNTMFSPWSYEFFNTDIFEKNSDAFSMMFFPLDLPIGIWWGYVKSFFDVVFEKYGNEHVIMLRFTACSHYIANDKKVYPIPDVCKKPWKANDKYNVKLRELEERIIREYNPHVVDYSKYYMGDSTYSEDIQGAHFSVEYYKESFKAIKEILLGIDKSKKIFCYERLSFSGIAELLEKDLSQEEFRKMWICIESPIKKLDECTVLKRLAQLSDDIIISNRFFISEICRLAEEMSYILENPLFSNADRIFVLFRHIGIWKAGNFTKEELCFLNCIFKGENINSFSYENLLQKFEVLFENDDIVWMDYLVAAEQMNPDSIEVLQYMKYYAVAIEDWAMAEMYEKRIERLLGM